MLLLTEIQKRQFSDKAGAELELLLFLKENEDSAIAKVELQPKPESLNSLNGFVTYASGERYFFKTHTEENEKVSEYYNAEELARAGYPVITSKQITQKVGKQIVLYQIITYPTLFDLMKVEEDKALNDTRSETNASTGSKTNVATESKTNSAMGSKAIDATTSETIAATAAVNFANKLLAGQIQLDKTVFDIYAKTLSHSSKEEQSKAPIHQLFSHRLADDGRVGLFYKRKSIQLGSEVVPFETLAKMNWTINGVDYSESISQLIDRSRNDLAPRQGPAIAGHGDAHNGNIFVDLEKSKFYMFDPAFAGRHHPLLDLTKPLFHNVFARWMYYPEQVIHEFDLKFDLHGDRIVIEHSFKPSVLRLGHLKTRVDNVLRPTVALLNGTGDFDDSWRSFVRSALFCCPFLTVNLFAEYVPNGTLSERYKLPIKLLGLAMAVELGAMAHKGSNQLTDIIDEVFA